MIDKLKTIFKRREKKPREYEGLSDFLLHASIEEKKEAIAKAARNANEDQFKVFEAARMKVGSN
jgi:hypothetical protein